jgi:hypothetical protein
MRTCKKCLQAFKASEFFGGSAVCRKCYYAKKAPGQRHPESIPVFQISQEGLDAMRQETKEIEALYEAQYAKDREARRFVRKY